MSTDVTPQPHQYDEGLARFTDRLLDGSSSDEIQSGPEQAELLELQRTVELVWGVLGQEEPDRTLRERIHQNLVAEWRDQEVGRQPDPFWRDWFSRWSQRSSGVPHGGVLLAAAASVLLLVIGAGLAASPSGGEISGAAGGSGPVALIAIGTGGLLFVLVWLFTSNHN